MRKWLRNKLPTRESINNQQSLKKISKFLRYPNLWSFNRHAVVRGATIGIVAALIPIPLQFFIAAFFAILFRGNLPIAVMITTINNPFTFVPINYLIYQIGNLIIYGHRTSIKPDVSWNFHSLVATWESLIAHFGVVYLTGLLVTMLLAGFLTYWIVNLIWRINIYLHLRARRKRHSK